MPDNPLIPNSLDVPLKGRRLSRLTADFYCRLKADKKANEVSNFYIIIYLNDL